MPTSVRGKEFIRGNHDGPYGVDDTYTVCRLSIPRQQLVEEIDEHHLHPGYRVLHMRDRHGNVVDERPQNTPDTLAFTNINQGNWPACCPAEAHAAEAADNQPPRRLSPDGVGVTEYIHGHRDGANRRNEHYTICRLGVPVRTLVREVREGFHPDYEVTYKGGQFHVRRKDGTEEPTWSCGMVCPLR